MAEASTSRVELRGISKAFPGVQALEGVDVHLNAGEVHALLGENGAGKSTLIKILTGALRSDAGEIRIDGKTVEINSRPEARALGISVVYQEVNLIETMSVTENLDSRTPAFASWADRLARGQGTRPGAAQAAQSRYRRRAAAGFVFRGDSAVGGHRARARRRHARPRPRRADRQPRRARGRDAVRHHPRS